MRILCKYRSIICLVSALVLFCSCINDRMSDTVLDSKDRMPAEYLEEVTPPCTPIGDPSQDPCQLGTVPHVETLSVNSSQSLGDRRPNFANRILGVDLPGQLVPHIAIRGTAQPGTTRCEAYPVKHADYVGFSDIASLVSTKGRYYCFVDIVVSEYLVGRGPPALTVAIHRETITDFDVDEWPSLRDGWIKAYADPRARTAAAYEGREMVMLLRATSTIHVEAWTSRGLFTLWFVHEGRWGDLRAVAYEIYLARTDEQLNMLDLALSDLVSQIRAAGVARAERIAAAEGDRSESRSADSSTTSATSSTVTTAAGTVRPVGGIGARAPVPLLVTDANYLRNLYVEVGATYEGEEATTVLPPPPPEAPGLPTNVGMSVEDGVILVTWDEPESGEDVEEYRVWLLSDLADGGTKSFYNVESYQGERLFEITYMVQYFGDEFTAQVRAGNHVGYSPWTDKQTFTTPTTPTTSTTAAG